MSSCWALRIALLCLAMVFFVRRSFAFCFAPELKVSDEYFVSSLVVTGTVLASHDLMDPSDKDSTTGTLYRVRIDRVYMNQSQAVNRSVTVYSENSTARFPMDVRGRYVLFLQLDPDHQLSVDNCGNSGLLSKSSHTLQQIRLLPLQHSFVYGTVYPYAGPKTCPPMRLSLHGPTTASTRVRSDCSFHAEVAPGNYTAQLSWKNKPVASYDLTYKDPYCFTVPSGGSAGLAFRPLNGADELNRSSVEHIDELERSFCRDGPQNRPRLQ